MEVGVAVLKEGGEKGVAVFVPAPGVGVLVYPAQLVGVDVKVNV